MARNQAFASRPPPFSDRDDLQLRDSQVSGPSKLFNPTRARYDHVVSTDDDRDAAHGKPQFLWRSRDNRKGRHTLIIPPDAKQTAPHLPPPTTSSKSVLKGITRMFTTFPYWDVSFLVAFFFSIGCAVFIVCGLFYWLPVAYPKTEFPHESGTAGGVTAFLGGTYFTIGAVFLMIEATNENQTGCFGWELEHAISEHHHNNHHHHHQDHEKSASTKNSTYRPGRQLCDHQHSPATGFLKGAEGTGPPRKWTWWPTWRELRTHYFREIGFWGSFTEFIGAAIFYINCILALPGVYPHLSQGVLWGIYWLTYLVGGVLFIVSSGLYLLETQPNWYTPAPHLLGWWVGFWNMVGSVGWTLAAALGYCDLHACEYQSDLTLIWASVAFLIGSLILWYEALDKYPVEVDGKRS